MAGIGTMGRVAVALNHAELGNGVGVSRAEGGKVGTFRVPVEIGDPEGQRWERVEGADGRQLECEMAETRVRLDGQVRTTLGIFGEEPAVPLLGAYTLEGFGLAPDPVGRRLIPVPGLLMAVGRIQI